MSRAEINTELLYTEDEHRLARELYASERPDGAWEQADRKVRARYLERGGQKWIRQTFG